MFALLPASYAGEPILQLQRSTDGMGTWEAVELQAWMLTGDGRLVPGLGSSGSVFYRLAIVEDVPDGMVLIPEGNFAMGDSAGDGISGALPVHTAWISSFMMQRTEVTLKQWTETVQWSPNFGYNDLFIEDASAKGPEYPVYDVTWYESICYANLKSELEGLTPVYMVDGVVYRSKEGLDQSTGELIDVQINYAANGYRLPTEAEWEKAARGGQSGLRFPWGETISHSQANYFAASPGNFSYDVNPVPGTHPNGQFTSKVGTFMPNGYGLYDMSGNVEEWCNDWLDGGYYAVSDNFDPKGPEAPPIPELASRVIRGGRWNSTADNCRNASRRGENPASSDFEQYRGGFRLVRKVF